MSGSRCDDVQLGLWPAAEAPRFEFVECGRGRRYYPAVGLDSFIPELEVDGVHDVILKLAENMEGLSSGAETTVLDLTRCVFSVGSVGEIEAICKMLGVYARWVLDTQTHIARESYDGFAFAYNALRYHIVGYVPPTDPKTTTTTGCALRLAPVFQDTDHYLYNQGDVDEDVDDDDDDWSTTDSVHGCAYATRRTDFCDHCIPYLDDLLCRYQEINKDRPNPGLSREFVNAIRYLTAAAA